MTRLISGDRQPKIKKSFIVCSTGRSGSKLLCQTLASFGNCGYPKEYLHAHNLAGVLAPQSQLSFHEYYLSILEKGTTVNGIFGVKIHWHHFKDFLAVTRQHLPRLADQHDMEIIRDLFPNVCFIHISRKDTLRQAVSTCLAHQTDVWSKPNQSYELEGTANIKFSPLEIYRYKIGITAHNQAWDTFFERNSIAPCRITYEELVSFYEKTIRKVYAFLDLPFEQGEISMPTYKQGNRINDRWVTYYNCLPERFIAQYSDLRVKVRKFLKA
ncbi:MAG: Stf0 family sulfotransferase [Leptolyngbyaceae cyanobacterium]